MSVSLRNFSEVSRGIALENQHFESDDREVLVWVASTTAIVCPSYFQNRPGFEEVSSKLKASGWPVFTRQTGGGAVPQGPGIINIALTFTVNGKFSINDGYQLIAQIIRDSLPNVEQLLKSGKTPGSICDGIWNLSIEGRKVVGTAQRWRPMDNNRIRILIHALILAHGDVVSGMYAVNDFNCGLGLDPIDANIHIALEKALGTEFPSQCEFANTLRLYAIHHLDVVEQRLARCRRYIHSKSGGINSNSIVPTKMEV